MHFMALLFFFFRITNVWATDESGLFIFKNIKETSGASYLDKTLTQEEIDQDILQEIFEQEQKIFELRLNALKKKVFTALAEKDASALKLTPDDYVNQKIIGEIKITEADIKKFLKDKDFPEDQVTPQFKDRVDAFLREEKQEEAKFRWLKRKLKGQGIVVNFRKPSPPIFKIADASSPSRGPSDAPVTMVIFSDFECPACAALAKTTDRLLALYDKKLKIVFKHLPLTIHPKAKSIHRISWCLWKKEQKLFHKFHDLVFAKQSAISSSEALKSVLTSSSHKYDEVIKCSEGPESDEAISVDILEAKRLKIRQTPTVFIDGQPVLGNLDEKRLINLIEETLPK